MARWFALLHGIWAEVRTLVIGEVEPPEQEHGEPVVHTRKLSYFSRKVKAETFDHLALVETHLRGIENAGQVAAVMDGAEWEQGFIDHHCPQATGILDFAHAAEHLGEVGASIYGENTAETHAWLDEHLHQLKHTRPDEILAEIRDLQEKFPENRKSQVVWLISKSVKNNALSHLSGTGLANREWHCGELQ